MQKIDINAALQAHPEFLNEKIDDHDKAVYAKGWNDCNKEYYNAIAELPVASIDCTDLSMRLRRAFEADELVNQRILLDAADAIEELIKEKARLENSGKLLVSAFERLKEKAPKWISVEERLPEKDEMAIVYYSWTGRSGTEYKEVSLATLDEMRYCGNKLLGWMPLPEAPKEETE